MTPTTVWRGSTADTRRLTPQLLLLAALVLSGMLPALVPPMPRLAQPLAQEAPKLSSEEAVTIATSGLPLAADTLDRMGRYTVEYQADGMSYQPRFGGPSLGWELEAVRAGAVDVAGVTVEGVEPHAAADSIAYSRGAIIERYVQRGAAEIERQLVLPTPLELNGADLTIDATLNSTGSFAATETGWEWRTDKGAVTLSQVRVTDAAGVSLSAVMEVSANRAQVTIDGGSLAGASFPVMAAQTVSQELPITSLSASGLLDAFEPAVAYSPATNSYLVVFSTDLRRDTEFEIYGQFIDAANGARKGEPFKISRIGTDQSNDIWDSFSPDVAYAPPGSFTNQFGTTNWAGGFAVVWAADNNNPPEGGYNSNGSFEIYTELVSESGQLMLAKSDRVSQIIAARWGMGQNPTFPSTPDWDAFAPAVKFDPVAGEFLLCWSSDRDNINDPETINGGAFEIWCKLFELAPGSNRPYFGSVPSGTEVVISTMGTTKLADPAGYALYDAYTPDIAYKPFVANGEGTADDEPRGFYVVWAGDDTGGGLEEGEFEIFGQFVTRSGETLAEVVNSTFRNDGRVSRVGEDTGCANNSCDAYYPAVAYNPDRAHYLITFTADNVNGRDEVFAVLRSRVGLGFTGGADLQQISEMGGSGDTVGNLKGLESAVSYDPGLKQYLVTWRGDNTTNDVFEIFYQRLDATTPTDTQLATSGDTSTSAEIGPADQKVGTSPAPAPNFYLRRTDSGIGSDNAVSGDTDLPFTTFHLQAPAVATNSKGEHLVVWAAETGVQQPGGSTPYQVDIRGQLFQFNSAPVITVPENIVLAPTGPSGTVVTYTAPTATDAEDGALTPTCTSAPTAGLSSGSTFPIGLTTITCTVADSLGKSASASFTVEVSEPTTWAELGLAQSIAPSPVRAGEPMTATFTITNGGPAAAAATVLTTNLPDGITFASGTPGCALQGSEVRCEVGAVATGTPATVTVVYNVDLFASGARTLNATVSSGQTDPNDDNNSVSASFDVAPSTAANVGATLTIAPSTVTAGGVVTATFTVANSGPAAASEVVLTASLPAESTFTSGPAGCELQGSEVRCTLGSLAKDANTTLDLVYTVAETAAPGERSITGTVAAASSDPVAENNSVTGNFVVALPTAANLSLSQSVAPSPVRAGATMTVTFAVSNAGPAQASSVVLTANIPAGTTFASGPAGCAVQSGQVVCQLSNLANGGSATVALVYNVAADASGQRSVTGTVASAQSDPVTSNNSSSGTISITPPPQPAGTKLFLPLLKR